MGRRYLLAADHEAVVPALTADDRVRFAALRAPAGPNVRLLTHVPMWGFGLRRAGRRELHFQDNPELQAPAGNIPPAGVQLILSGQIRDFRNLSFAAARPSRLIVGNSGTLLVLPIATPVTGPEIGATIMAVSGTCDRFGCVTLGWDRGAAPYPWRSAARVSGRTAGDAL